MNVYAVINKTTGAQVYEYQSDVLVEWVDYPFSEFEHVERPPVVVDTLPVAEAVWRIYVGAFFDRFGAAKLEILASTDPLVEALIKDASVRQYIALTERRAELLAMIGLLQSKGFALDATAILDLEPTADEVWNG